MTNKFKVGDQVNCSLYGEGIVIKISKKNTVFPVRVQFEDQDDNDYVEYTTEGSSILNSPVTLTKI